jgi:hypothetical protein
MLRRRLLLRSLVFACEVVQKSAVVEISACCSCVTCSVVLVSSRAVGSRHCLYSVLLCVVPRGWRRPYGRRGLHARYSRMLVPRAGDARMGVADCTCQVS